MRKLIFIQLFVVCNVAGLLAQPKVSENGNVCIATNEGGALLNVGGAGTANHAIFVEGDKAVIHAQRRGSNPNYWGTVLNAENEILSGNGDIGVTGNTYSSTVLTRGRAIGVRGIGGNATSGYNYGVIGTLRGSNNGAGVLGVASNTDSGFGFYIPGYYAGYFQGNVKVTGTINGITVRYSDIRYKQNIIGLNELSSSNNILKTTNGSKTNSSILSTVLELNPVQYNYKQVYSEPEGDTSTVKQGFFNERSQVFQKKQYGLIAQELQEIYPELVYEEDDGYLSINYIGLIPLLIQSIKELNGTVEALNSEVEELRTNVSKISLNQATDNVAVLYQNTPNPFNQSTEIKYYLPGTATSAYLCFYDLQGKQLKQITLSGSGEGSQLINGSQFSPGIYLYALIVDGQEVDIKRMILTE